MNPIISVSDTVTIDGETGRWIIESIYPGAAYAPAHITASRVRSSHGVITSEVLKLGDPASLHFVRARNELDDELAALDVDTGMSSRQFRYAIIDGQIRELAAYRAEILSA